MTISATVNNNTPVGTTLPNDAYLTYTSLPGTGSDPNPTDSTTPGASGDSDGERDGSGGLNDYFDSDDTTVTLDLPAFSKEVDPITYTIGSEIEFDLLVTLPEGVTPDLVITDTIPSGLSIIGYEIVTSAADSNGLLSNDFNGTIPGPTVSAPGGDGVDGVWSFGNTTSAGDNDATTNNFILRVTAVVLDISGNQDGDNRTNSAAMSYTVVGSPTTLSDSVSIDICRTGIDDRQKHRRPDSLSFGYWHRHHLSGRFGP